MEPSSSSQTIDCIGKCNYKLKCDHLDKVTDNIKNTLEDKEGVKIFKEYIKENSTKEFYDCVELYETCDEYLKTSGKKEHQVKSRIKTVMEKVKKLDGVAGLNLALLKRMNEIESRTDWKNEAFDILSEIARCCLDHLRSIHESFKRYMAKPCSSIK
ncbi:uncharacterized protein LOC128884773 isoform X2 [Hylaeus volcanicus]|nr:uncharacterized protein LOC128884773 isoform X2 [Hylaeus volcanicus]XP_053994363.1 uncharacterized protein LOC128884773 isoform X2 [Hylaeus volcanicus]XP_053994364.1 uncharacterized protein LOC128884773 isoform X2 [Hylaeus volcanicus]XP_053994365.1 uncharacterized protein LOC128884773 isoform X2 [Hylaeus volcanicus]XP_053994366.1 uncharacterized protein LOC128884773 isoform X2 [Hylaeus volcanicus]